MEEARPRFVEAAQIVIKALSNPVFSHEGEFFQIAPMSIRPRPISHPERRFYASSVSPESAEIMARLGFGVLVIPRNVFPKVGEDIRRYRDIASSVGHTPRPPIVVTNVSCHESRDEAVALAQVHMAERWDSIDAHYHFSDGHLASVKGYESYGRMAKTYTKMKDPAARTEATKFYITLQVVGTPKDCLEQIREMQRHTGFGHLVTEFTFGGLAYEHAEISMRLFARQVGPVLQTDPAYGIEPDSPLVLPIDQDPGVTDHPEGVFAPA
ncbi:MAG: LLM class flavin-dependent oxidoreductase [Chloroflexi bacterium]|nr:LLM class flavin-dependent oxidoreductase [Chloroflexota bacterium]